MRMIHEKFEEDVGNHLEDFKSAIEGLEVGANQQSKFASVINYFTFFHIYTFLTLSYVTDLQRGFRSRNS